MHATGCFAELYFSPVVGLGPMVDLNLAYLLKGEHIHTSNTQQVVFWGLVVFFSSDQYCNCMWMRGVGHSFFFFFFLLGFF